MGSNKGSGFEREISVKLSLWWTNGEREDVFWRRDSGARAKRRSREGKNTFGAHGDICAIDPIGLPLTNVATLELKKGYNKWSLLDVVDRPPMKKNQKKETIQTFESFVQQVVEDANAVNTYPVIIAKRDKRQSIIILPRMLYKKIFEYYKRSPNETILTISKNKYIKSMLAMNVMTFDGFLDWCKPDFFYHEDKSNG